MMPNRHLAITMGDPAGIGPEIIVKACAKLRSRLEASDLKLLVIGSGRAFEQANRQLGAGLDVARVGIDDADWPNLSFLQADEEGEPIQPGGALRRRRTVCLQGDRAGCSPCLGRTGRRHRHRAAQQGGA